jgi:hypothetical protein
MKGDYRTGKRLNMKKIIPYIASQFKKDKIWLRRSKPAKREYQVCFDCRHVEPPFTGTRDHFSRVSPGTWVRAVERPFNTRRS